MTDDVSYQLMTASAFGVTVGLVVAEGALDGVERGLPHWWQSSSATAAPDKTWHIPVGAPRSVAESIISELELWVAEHAVDRIFIHSGVLAVDGRALLLPGRSFAGKTTLTAALVRAGAEYGSDEYAPLRADGLVETYARPLWVRPIGGGDRHRVTADELGGATFTEAIPVGGVALLRFDMNAGWNVTAISAGAAVLGLVDNCVPARSRPAPMLETLSVAVEGAAFINGTRGDADEAAGRLIEWMSVLP